MRKGAKAGRAAAPSLPEAAVQRYTADIERLQAALGEAEIDQAPAAEIDRIKAAIAQATTMRDRAQNWAGRAVAAGPAAAPTPPAPDPDPGVSRWTRSRCRLARRTVEDPDADNRKVKIEAIVNRGVDVLEDELAAGTISARQFGTGREMQQIWDTTGAVGSVDLAGEVRGPRHVEQGLSQPDLKLLRSIARARAANCLSLHLYALIGVAQTRFLRAALLGERSIAGSPAGRAWFATALRDAVDHKGTGRAMWEARQELKVEGPETDEEAGSAERPPSRLDDERRGIRFVRIEGPGSLVPPPPDAARPIVPLVITGKGGGQRPPPPAHLLPLAAE